MADLFSIDDVMSDFSNLSLTPTQSGSDQVPLDNLDVNGLNVTSNSNNSNIPTPSIGAGTLTSAFGSVIQGIGGYMQGQEEAGADEYNASLALMQGEFNVQNIGLQEGETLSTQKAMYAKAGVEQSGSVLDTALNTATNFEYDKQVATFNAKSAANMDQYEARVAKQQGGFALGAGIAEAGLDIASSIFHF